MRDEAPRQPCDPRETPNLGALLDALVDACQEFCPEHDPKCNAKHRAREVAARAAVEAHIARFEARASRAEETLRDVLPHALRMLAIAAGDVTVFENRATLEAREAFTRAALSGERAAP